MNNGYLACPRCNCKKFYAREAGGKMVFFHVDLEQWPVPTDVTCSDLHHVDFSPIHCTGCSWSGEMHDLVSPTAS